MAKWNPIDEIPDQDPSANNAVSMQEWLTNYEVYGNMLVPKNTFIGGLGSNRTFYIPAAFTCCGHPDWENHPNNYSDGHNNPSHKNDIHMQGAVHLIFVAPNDFPGTDLVGPKIADGLKEYTSHWMMFHKTGPVPEQLHEYYDDATGDKPPVNLLDKTYIAQLLDPANKKWVFFNDNARHGGSNFTLRDGTKSPHGVKRFVESNFTFLPYVRLGWDDIYGMDIWDMALAGAVGFAGLWLDHPGVFLPTTGAEYLALSETSANKTDYLAKYCGLTSTAVPTVYGPVYGLIGQNPGTIGADKFLGQWLTISDWADPEQNQAIGDLMAKYYGETPGVNIDWAGGDPAGNFIPGDPDLPGPEGLTQFIYACGKTDGTPGVVPIDPDNPDGEHTGICTFMDGTIIDWKSQDAKEMIAALMSTGTSPTAAVVMPGYYIFNDDFVIRKMLATLPGLKVSKDLPSTTLVKGEAPPLYFPIANDSTRQLQTKFMASGGTVHGDQDLESKSITSTWLKTAEKKPNLDFHPKDVAKNMQHAHQYYVDENGNGFTTATISQANYDYTASTLPNLSGIKLQWYKTDEFQLKVTPSNQTGPWNLQNIIKFSDHNYRPTWPDTDQGVPIEQGYGWYLPDQYIEQNIEGDFQSGLRFFKKYDAIRHHVHPIMNWTVMPIGINVYAPEQGSSGDDPEVWNPNYPLMFPPDVKWVHDHIADDKVSTSYSRENIANTSNSWQKREIKNDDGMWKEKPVPGGLMSGGGNENVNGDDLRGDVYLEMLDLHLNTQAMMALYGPDGKHKFPIHPLSSFLGDSQIKPSGQSPSKKVGVSLFLEPVYAKKVQQDILNIKELHEGKPEPLIKKMLEQYGMTGTELFDQAAESHELRESVLSWAVNLFHLHLKETLTHTNGNQKLDNIHLIPSMRPPLARNRTAGNIEGLEPFYSYAGDNNFSQNLLENFISIPGDLVNEVSVFGGKNMFGFTSPSWIYKTGAPSIAGKVAHWDLTHMLELPPFRQKENRSIEARYNFHDIQYEKWVTKYAGEWSTALIPSIWLHAMIRENQSDFLNGYASDILKQLISAGGIIPEKYWLPGGKNSFTGLQNYFDAWADQPGTEKSTKVSDRALRKGENMLFCNKDLPILQKYGISSNVKLNFPMNIDIRFKVADQSDDREFASLLNENEVVFRNLMGHLFPEAHKIGGAPSPWAQTIGSANALNFAKKAGLGYYAVWGKNSEESGLSVSDIANNAFKKGNKFNPYGTEYEGLPKGSQRWSTGENPTFWNITNFFYCAGNYGAYYFDDWKTPPNGSGLGGYPPKVNAIQIDGTEYSNQQDFLDEIGQEDNLANLVDFIREKKRSVKDIFDGKRAYSEAIFFEIEKHPHVVKNAAGDVIQKNEDRFQRFFFAMPTTKGSDDKFVQDVIEFVDTQIEYGKSYTYKFYSYNIVIGNKYQYWDYLSFMTAGLKMGRKDLGPGDTVFLGENALEGKVGKLGKDEKLAIEAQNNIIIYPLEGGTKRSDTEVVGQWKLINQPQVFLVRKWVWSPPKISVRDKPPMPPDIDPLPLKDKKDKMLYWLGVSPGEMIATPRPILEGDEKKFKEYATSQDQDNISLENVKLHFNTDDPVRRFDVFKLDFKPTSYKDFAQGHIPLEDGDNNFMDTVEPNKKYYYVFRTIDMHDQISNPSLVYEVEIVLNSGAVYPIVRIADFEKTANKSKTKHMKKYVHIVPTMENSVPSVPPDPDPVKYPERGTPEKAFSKYLDTVGLFSEPEDTPKFKIRFTSKSTGKKFDINLRFLHEHIPGVTVDGTYNEGKVLCPEGYEWDEVADKCIKK